MAGEAARLASSRRIGMTSMVRNRVSRCEGLSAAQLDPTILAEEQGLELSAANPVTATQRRVGAGVR